MRIIDTSEYNKVEGTRNENDWVYNGLDCAVTLEVLYELEKNQDNTTQGTYNFSRSLQAPILEMGLRGLLVDYEQRDKTLGSIKEDIDRVSLNLTRIIRDGIGVNINWRSPAQVKNLLYDVMGIPPIRKRNAAGKFAPTVNRDALERLQVHFAAEPICTHLLALRDLDKKRSWLETGIDPDGRMRTSFNIAGTNTGRLSASENEFGTGTNLMNVNRKLRQVFIADPGMKFANLDLEQADSRNLGALCWELFYHEYGEKFAGSYLDACESGDLHTTVCRMARPSLPWTDDPKANRAIADTIYYRGDSYRDLDKKLGHGTNYYGTPPTMAKHAKVPRPEVELFQNNYFTAFPCIGAANKRDHTTPNYHNWVRRQLRDRLPIITPFGRRRFFHGRYNDDKTLRDAIAYSPQSMTADEIDTGIIRLWQLNRVQLLLQVHDSILFQYPEELEDEIIPWALETLVTTLELVGGRKFAVPTEAQVGWNYGKFDKDENPDGLMKWKGGDERKRQRKFMRI